MKTKITHIASLFFIALLWTSFAHGQEKTLPAIIDKDLSLSGGEYKVVHTRIEENATLFIDKETVLIFEKDAFIHVKGGLQIKGENNAFVNIRSKDAKAQGIGFVFSDHSKTNIRIDHARFTHIQKPIEFKKNWLRSEVQITHCVFKNLYENKVPIEIKSADNLLINKDLKVIISNNTFSNNYSSILLTNISSDLLSYEFRQNVITQNMYFGADQNGLFTSPVFVNYNKSSNPKIPTFSNNSFVFNYTAMLEGDKIEFFQPFLYTTGTADRLDLANNYLGQINEEEIEKIIRQIQAENQAPIITHKGRLTEPTKDLNGHIYNISVNDNPASAQPFPVPINENLRRITLTSNRPIQGSEFYKVQHHYLINDTIVVEELKHKLSYASGYKDVVVDFNDNSLKNHPNGYIVIDGFYDINGFDVPAVTIGMFDFLTENQDFISYFENLAQIPKKYLVKIDEPEDMNPQIDSSKIKEAQKDSTDDEVPYPYKWDAGVFAGSTIYFGDLANTGIQFYLPNTRPNIGFRLGYRANEHIRFELSQNTMIITGDDRKESVVGKNRGTNYERGLSFRTTIVDLGINLEYQILKYKKMNSIVPSLMVGITGYYFNPQGNYNGTWFALRPFGTEGQTQNGGDPYGKYSYAIPFGFKVSRHINKRNLICLSYTYNKLFTDYLDDVSTGNFQSRMEISKTNTEDGPIAYQLANPNDLTGQRSFSDSYDGFAYWGFTWLYRF